MFREHVWGLCRNVRSAEGKRGGSAGDGGGGNGRLLFRGSLMKSHRMQKTPPWGSGGVSGFWLHENSASVAGLLMALAYLWPVREGTAKFFRYNARCPGFRDCVGREKGDFLSEDSIFMSSVATWRPFSEARHC